jgi:hypothetical protein
MLPSSGQTDYEQSTRQRSVTFWKTKIHIVGTRGSVLVKALCYKPEGRGLETR